jgi:hypothetical protein
MAIKILKLTSGDLVIADVKEFADYVEANRPLEMIINDKGIALKMWCPCDLSEPVTIDRSHIIAMPNAVKPLADEYESRFIANNGQGIVTPEAPKLVVPG